MFTKRTNKNKNIRKKETSLDEKNEASNLPETVKKPTKVLSFDENEHADTEFKEKKSVSSKRVSKIKDKKISLQQAQLPQNIHSGVTASTKTSYTPEVLQELLVSSSKIATTTNLTSESTKTDEAEPTIDSTVDNNDDVLSRFSGSANDLPNASLVHAARKKREFLRNRVEEEFIPLSDKTEVMLKPDNEGRLATEEDELDDGEREFEEYMGDRILFANDSMNQYNLQKKKNAKELVSRHDMNEDDEEVRAWEMEMIRKGGAANHKEIGKKQLKKALANISDQSGKIPDEIPLPTIDNVVNNVQKELTKSRLKASELENKVGHCSRNVDATKDFLQKSTPKLNDLTSKYNFFRDLTDFFDDFAEFLDEKIPELEELEKQLFEKVRNNVAKINLRRQNKQDNEISLLQSGGDTIVEASPEDPFLLNKNEMDMEFQDELIKLEHFFDEVKEEYSSLSPCVRQFECYKTNYPFEYSESYTPLAIPSVLEIFVIHELFFWNPFKNNYPIDEMKWHQAICESTLLSGDNNNDGFAILKKLVERCCIPKLEKWLCSFDLFSTQQVENVVNYIKQIQFYFEDKDDIIQAMILKLREFAENAFSSFYLYSAKYEMKDSTCLSHEQQSTIARNKQRIMLLCDNMKTLSTVCGNFQLASHIYANTAK